MADELHVFEASGDPCPLCASLAGQVVPAGYQPHPGCLCRTVKRKDGVECEYVGVSWEMDTPPYRTAAVTITVECPDGSKVDYETTVDTSTATTDEEWGELTSRAMYDAAESVCEGCPDVEPENVS
jgi:hypothetical protein